MTQLVTAAYLRREVAVNKVIPDIALVAAEMLCGPVHRYASRIVLDDARFTGDGDCPFQVILNDAPGRQRHVRGVVTLNGADYDTGKGSVEQHSCHQLPSAGPVTTGEWRTVDNTDGASPISQHFELSIEETTDISTELTESIEIKAGVSAEAGSDVAKVSATLETTLGISKDQVTDKSDAVSTTISFDSEVQPGHKTTTVITQEPGAIDCDVSIGAPVDYSDLRVSVTVPDGAADDWDALYRWLPGVYTNLKAELDRGLVQFAGATASMSFDSVDGFYRAAMGFDVRAADVRLRFSGVARAALARLSDSERRRIAFSGLQRTSTRKDTSYKAVDTSNVTNKEISDALAAPGLQVDDALGKLQAAG